MSTTLQTPENSKSQPGSVRAAKLAASKRQTRQTGSNPDANFVVNRLRRPNYAQIHSRPLPIVTYPLPTFVAHNPLSYLHIVYTVIRHFFLPPNSHINAAEGYFDAPSRSVHVTIPKHVQVLWKMGFFGKGSLSRSEPTWLNQEQNRLGLNAAETSEQVTNKRRKERERMKRDRQRVELEAIEEQLRKEAGSPVPSEATQTIDLDVNLEAATTLTTHDLKRADLEHPSTTSACKNKHGPSGSSGPSSIEVVNQEHLQLSLVEAFFLTYGLGCLKLSNMDALDTPSLLQSFRQHSYFPPCPVSALSPDDPFLVQYVVYHHFRSLGWVVRDGIKFAVDYLLYDRGPVFNHAAFAVVIIPSYSHPYWQQQEENGGAKTKMQRMTAARNWTWFHCANRVQNHVVKTLVLVYLDIPPPMSLESKDMAGLLKQYKVREFCIKRWSANRNRA